MEQSILEIVIYGTILMFIIGIIWMAGNYMLGGFVKPLIKGLDPHNPAGQGIETTQYQNSADHIYVGFRYFFYIIMGGIVFVLFIKAWYSREEISQGMFG